MRRRELLLVALVFVCFLFGFLQGWSASLLLTCKGVFYAEIPPSITVSSGSKEKVLAKELVAVQAEQEEQEDLQLKFNGDFFINPEKHGLPTEFKNSSLLENVANEYHGRFGEQPIIIFETVTGGFFDPAFSSGKRNDPIETTLNLPCSIPCQMKECQASEHADVFIVNPFIDTTCYPMFHKGPQENTLWALWYTEPFYFDPQFLNQYDFVMGFLPGADIYLPPWQLHQPLIDLPLILSNSTKVTSLEGIRHKITIKRYSFEEKKQFGQPPVFFLANHCTGERENFLLQFRLGVSAPGECGGANVQIPPDIVDEASRLVEKGVMTGFQGMFYQKHRFMARHFFDLSFENANVQFWMTERFVAPYIAGVIPIYWGSPVNKNYIPHPHSAIFVQDFPDTESLAQHLESLLNDSTKYDEYLSWRNLPKHQLNPRFLMMMDNSVRYRSMCTLCKFVARERLNPGIWSFLKERKELFINPF